MSSGVDRQYRIRIETAGDPSGAKSVGDAIDRTTESTEGASRATEKHSASLHAMHRLFHALNEVVPGLGVAMQAAFSPIGATISLAVMALQLFREHLRKVNEELDKMAEENARPLTNRLEAMRETVVSNAREMAALKDRLAEAARQQQVLANATDQAVAAAKEQAALAQSKDKGWMSQDLVILEQLHKAGLVSEEQYAADKLAIEQHYIEHKRQLEENAAMREILIRQRSQEQAEMKQPELHEDTLRTQKATLQAGENLKSLPTDEQLKALVKAAEDDLQKAHKATESARTRLSWAESATGVPSDPGRKKLAGLEADEALAEKRVEQRKADIVTNTNARAAATAAVQTTADANKVAADLEIENQKFTTLTAREVENLRARFTLIKQANAESNQLDRETNRLKGPRGQAEIAEAGKEMAEGADVSRRVTHRLPSEAAPSRDELQHLVDLASHLEGKPVDLKEAIRKLEAVRTGRENYNDDILRLITVQENMIKAFNAGAKPSSSRIDALERAVENITHQFPGN